MTTSIILQGRLIRPEDLEAIRALCASHPDWHRTRLSQELCRRWQWVDATGRLKDMACRSLFAKLEQRQLVQLPAGRRRSARPHRGSTAFQPVLHSTEPIHGTLQDLLPLALRPADSGDERPLWQTFLSLYHYLGFTTKVGKNLSYLIRDRHQRPVACLLFGAAAWKTAPRDQFIGWTPAHRQAHLEKVVNNMRFLVLPWVQVPHLASHVLGRVLRQLPDDWQRKYGHPIALVETFVDRSRFRGTCYKAANFIDVGETQGRSRNDVEHRLQVPRKAIFLYPLTADFRTQLTASITPHPGA